MLGLRGELGPDEVVGKYRIVLPLGQGGTADVYLAVADGPSGFQKLVVLKVLAQEPRQRPGVPGHVPQRGAAGGAPAPPEHRPDQRGHRGRRRAGDGDGVPGRPAAVAGDRARAGRGPSRWRCSCACWPTRWPACTPPTSWPTSTARRSASCTATCRPTTCSSRVEGHAKVLDFGIAKLERSLVETEVGTVKGKLRYMAPEQVAGEKLDRRADVYAAGVILWEALTGERMWKGTARSRRSGRACWRAICRCPSGAARRARAAGRDLPARAVAARPTIAIRPRAQLADDLEGGAAGAGEPRPATARSARRWRGCSRTCAAETRRAIEPKLGDASALTPTPTAGTDSGSSPPRRAGPCARAGGGAAWWSALASGGGDRSCCVRRVAAGGAAPCSGTAPRPPRRRSAPRRRRRRRRAPRPAAVPVRTELHDVQIAGRGGARRPGPRARARAAGRAAPGGADGRPHAAAAGQPRPRPRPPRRRRPPLPPRRATASTRSSSIRTGSRRFRPECM